MYPLNFETATAVDVIARSAACHPSALADGLALACETHALYAGQYGTSPGANGAREAAKHAQKALAQLILADDPATAARAICAETGPMVQALTVAFRLQVVPRHLRAGIASRVGL